MVLDNVRLVPKEQQAWFGHNAMMRFNYSRRIKNLTNDIANGITLRSDIQRCLDGAAFVFVRFGQADAERARIRELASAA